ncbi:hypothetical protein [Salinibacter ruber]|uniref:Uncharacterized protein n=1 Tax=Salinibacter ruber TaxID=146919 RepID=A0A9X2ZT62_9BACT|nr:hypothetical protein [Salinibacter ruber]MCS3953105.1 hypothetical protein [Salinibacter ruber]
MPESESSKAGPISSRYEFIPDPGKETVEIPVEVENGVVRFKTRPDDKDREPLPDLEDGATGTLTVLASALENEEDYERLAGEILEIILPSSVLVWLKIKTDHRQRDEIPEYGKAYLGRYDLPLTGRGYRLIPVALREHLWLRHRGMKDPEVQACRCSVPEPLQSQGGEDVPSVLPSLHQAYMGLSEIFEKQRETHGGNVYTKGYFWSPSSGGWKKLDFFRGRTPRRCIWMEKNWRWLEPFWVKAGEHPATVWGDVDSQGRWDAHSPELGDPNGSDRTLTEVTRALGKRGYAPYDPFEDAPPPKVLLEKRNWEDPQRHWDFGQPLGKKEAS